MITGDVLRANGVDYPVLSDSGVYTVEEGYQREVIINGWLAGKPRQMAKVSIRVDRIPAKSYAKIESWTIQAGWQLVGQIDHRDFWPDMPSYLRWSKDTSDDKTGRLAADLVADLVINATFADI